ncbi:hypothetical protein KY495_23740 [Massilia sp. PAMC28688]|uniref:hypothetical protein n=1 Tax=Massilia sp. PAMC28688 TaxID=2861283 RepID=UPI001C634271|nr:hypothetical protein [Massilia sp. PAMC28688]QYF93628.1 hypothetical protein KY495_23740 [Massilia sp. PAMC28688]
MDIQLVETLLLGLAGVAGGAWLAFVLPRMVEAQRRLALVRSQRQNDLRRR